MAKTKEDASEAKAGKPKSIVGALVASVVLVVASGGAGYAFSKFHLSPQFMTVPVAEPMKPEGEMADDKEHASKDGEDYAGKALTVSELQPMTTNIAEPDNIWLRAELSLLHNEELEPEAIEAIHQELFAYLRTTKLRSIRGASGLQHLMEDLDSIAQTRTEGRVERVLIRGLIFE